MILLPPELKIDIVSRLDEPAALSRLGRSCRIWYEVANEELYKRDARENNSFAIKRMAVYARDEKTIDDAIRTLKISRLWGGQIDAVGPALTSQQTSNRTQRIHALTALGIGVALGNVPLVESLLDEGARHDIPCSIMSSSLPQSLRFRYRVRYFKEVFKDYFRSDNALPIFLAFLRTDLDMCHCLLERGVERDAMIVGSGPHSTRISILHFVAADPTRECGQWRFFYDRFREHINEPCTAMNLTPLHVAMMSGCVQGVYDTLEYGADKEARNVDLQTPIMMGRSRDLLPRDR